MTVCGVVLAAGAGRRYGGPKALAVASDGVPWVEAMAGVLAESGCAPVIVALGAAAAEASPLVPASAQVVEVADWAGGLSVTVRAALRAAAASGATAVLITPVDLWGLPASVCRRLLGADGTRGAHGAAAPVQPTVLRRATYRGRLGNPALIGRAHWAALDEELTGDQGAGAYLTRHGAAPVECGDLWHGRDVDARA